MSGDTRIKPVPPSQWPQALRAVHEASAKDGSGRENLFGTLAHHPLLAGAWLSLAQTLTHQGALGARDRELVFLRTAHLLRSEFIRRRHTTHAVSAGLSPAEIAATAEPLAAHPWDIGDLVVLQATDELRQHADITDPTWQRLTERFDHRQLVELLLLAGQCAAIAVTLRTFRTPTDGMTS